MIVVDSSVWIDYVNGFASPEAELLLSLPHHALATTGLIVTEVLQGLRSERDADRLAAFFSTYVRSVEPRGSATYVAAARLYRALRARGITVRSTIDCLIAQIAEENDADVLSRDVDLRRIVESGLCRARLLAVH